MKTDRESGASRWRRQKEQEELEREPFVYRLAAAFVAIPAFCVSLYLSIVVLLSGSRLSAYVILEIPLFVHLLYMLLAACTGLLFGFRGLTWLLGHLFMTHLESERNSIITVGLWCSFGVLVLLGYLAKSGGA